MKPNDKAYQAAISAIKENGPYYAGSKIRESMAKHLAEVALPAAYAAQFPPSEDYAGLVEWLRNKAESLSEIYPPEAEAADALSSTLAERDEWKGRQEATAAILKRVETERDALLASLAPVEAIENDKDDPTREYIPLPGGWEIQTKGRGSSHRLLDKKTGERHMILAADALFVQEFVMRMAKEINASAQMRPVAPVDDYNLEIMAAKEFIEATTDMPPRTTYTISKRSLSGARNAIAAIRPHIEAAEREKCAKIAEHLNGWGSDFGKGGHALHIAAAIRRGE